MKRILLIGLTPFQSGINSFIKNTYPYMDRSLFRYDFLMMEQYKDKKLSEDFDVSDSRFYYLDFNRLSLPESSYKDLESIMASIPDLCGVHIHDVSHITYPLVVADRMGLPIKVIQFHTGYPKKNHRELFDVDEKTKTRLEWIRDDSFDRLACSDLAGELGFQGMPYEIIPNGINPEKYTYNSFYRKLIREKMHIPDDAYVFGFFANITNNKNPFFALKVFQEFLKLKPNSVFVFVGINHIGNRLNKYIKENHLEEHVHLFQTDDSIDMLYSAVDLLLFTSFREGIGYVLIEAQASGLPCLISDEVTDMVKITDLAHMAPLDASPKYWAKKALQILQDQKIRVSRTKEIIDAGYNAKDVAMKIQNIYLRRLEGF